MSESVLDFAGLDATAAAATPEPPVADSTPEVDASAPTTEATPEGEQLESSTPEGTQAEGEGKPGETAAPKAEDLPGDKNTPDSIRKALKALKDADPKNASAVKELHGAFERWNAAKSIFPNGVQEMREAKAFMEMVGGPEGYEELSETVAAIQASDDKLYAGDPSILDDIIEDLKAEGKLDSFSKLAPHYLDKLKQADSAGYYATLKPHFAAGLQEVGFERAISALMAELGKPENQGVDNAKQIAQNIDKWLKDTIADVEKSKANEVSPERKALEEERRKFQEQIKAHESQKSEAFKSEVGSAAETLNNKSLGAALGPYLRMEFFKEFSRDNLMPLGNAIKTDLFTTLKEDKAYQTQMKALWKKGDRAAILDYHKSKVESMAPDVVRRTVQKMYPGYAKGGTAAPRIAKQVQKVEAQKQQVARSLASGNPIYVGTKPAWDSIDWNKDPKQLLYIGGKAYLKDGKFVTWRKK